MRLQEVIHLSEMRILEEMIVQETIHLPEMKTKEKLLHKEAHLLEAKVIQTSLEDDNSFSV